MTTDEAEKPKEQVQDPTPSPPQETPAGPAPGSPQEDPQLKPRSRNSAGRGLSRLFSSFLKRSSEGEGLPAQGAEREKAGQEGVELKAPIAAPEPELRNEGDPALDQHSLSSGEIQVRLHPFHQ